jgi:hypothetical protein
MELTGKGYYLWQVKRAFEGNPAKIAEAAQQAGLRHMLIKVADGVYGYNITNGVDMVPDLVAALRARGISPWGWQYIYGVNPTNEARRAIARVNQLGLDGFVVNAEKQFKAANMAKVAKAYMKELRSGLPKLTIGLSTYRYPNLHAPFPFTTFLEYCDINLPQVYWVGSSNPAQQLQRSINEYKVLKPNRPIVPTGAAYGEGSWSPTGQQILEFLQAARSQGLAGASFWEWQTAYLKPDVWNAVRQYNWETPQAPVPPPVVPAPPTPTPPAPAPAPVKPVTPTVRDPRAQQAQAIGQRLIAALNSGKANQVVFLYEEDGHLACNGQGRTGSRELYSWYVNLFKDTFPKATFRLVDSGVYGEFLRVVWSATLANGKMARGTDLIRMDREGKLIAHHNVAFSVSKVMERNPA